MRETTYVDLDVGTILKETDLAFLFLTDDGDEIWVPKSVIEHADDYDEGDENKTISIAEWWMEKEGHL